MSWYCGVFVISTDATCSATSCSSSYRSPWQRWDDAASVIIDVIHHWSFYRSHSCELCSSYDRRRDVSAAGCWCHTAVSVARSVFALLSCVSFIIIVVIIIILMCWFHDECYINKLKWKLANESQQVLNAGLLPLNASCSKLLLCRGSSIILV